MRQRTPSLVVQLHLKPLINNNRGGNSSNAHYCLFANPTAQKRNRTWTDGTPPMMHSMLWWATSLAIFLAANKSCDGLVDNHSSQNAQWVKQFKTQWNFHNLFKKGEFICSGRRDGFRKGNDFFQALPKLPPPTPPFPQFSQLAKLIFWCQNSRFESQLRTRNTIYTM